MTNNSAQVVSRTTTSMTVKVYSNHNTGPEAEDAPFSIMVAGQAAEAAAAEAVHFDGATYISMSTFTGVSSSSAGAMSVWINTDSISGDGDNMIVSDFDQSRFVVDYGFGSSPANSYRGFGANGASSSGWGTSASTVTLSTWVNVLYSWDFTATSSVAAVATVYLNDVAQPLVDFGINASPFTIRYDTIPGWAIGASFITSGSITQEFFTGDMYDFWFAPGQFIDFSITANRRLFIDALGSPVDLGSNGQTPTGTAPAIFFHGGAGTFGTNQGTAGTAATSGTLTNATAPP